MPIKDQNGGLAPEGRRYFARKQGAKLEPAVKAATNTPGKMRRKGSLLRHHFARPRGPLLDESGKPTRLAISAPARGESVPKTATATATAARRLAAKGTRRLERYAETKTSKTVPRPKTKGPSHARAARK